MVASGGRKVEAASVELVASCHATEDCGRVLAALKNLMPPHLRDRVIFLEEQQKGYYGNPITIIRASIIEEAGEALSYIASNLPESEKRVLGLTLDLRYDQREKRLVIRLSKQDAYLGALRLLDQDDIIKLTVRFKRAGRVDELREYLKDINLLIS